jgi:hypothetical protein
MTSLLDPRPDTAARAPRGRGHRASRAMFYAHLWLGVVLTALLLVISVTGVLLNNKRALGLMPDVEHTTTAPLAAARPIDELARAAVTASGLTGDDARVDRMDVRPSDGYVKVRLRDPRTTEVTVDLATARVLHVGTRGDVFLEQLHSGEAFGDGWTLLSDAAAVGLVVLLISGYWLWLHPRWRRR